ncbi:MAG: S8 family serine peptidase [Deltaproteobacteria bacterium]|nr:S8 family serine peptidase [Deltaproteobacteria bacterium]
MQRIGLAALVTLSFCAPPPPAPIGGDGASDRLPPFRRTSVPAPLPVADGAERVSAWPDVQRIVQIDPNDLTKVHVVLPIANTTSRAIDHLRIDVMVDVIGGVATAEGASGDGFVATTSNDPTCAFTLPAGGVFDVGATATLACDARIPAGRLDGVRTRVTPTPFIADVDFDQVNDFLAAQIARMPSDRVAIAVSLEDDYMEAVDRPLFEAHGGEIEDALEGEREFTGTLPAGEVFAYREALGSRLAFIDPDAELVYYLDVAATNLRATQVWAANPQHRGDPQTSVAIVDSGLDSTHAGLQFAAGALGAGAAKVIGWNDDLLPAAAVPTDVVGHGSHVGGIAAGAGVAAPMGGTATPPGIARDTKLVGLRVRGTSNSSLRSFRWLEMGAAGMHTIVANMSMGSSVPQVVSERRANHLVESGILFVVAAGNEFDSTGYVSSPGTAAKVVTVAAAIDAGILASYSSNGFGGARTKPDVTAPGGISRLLPTLLQQSEIRSIRSNAAPAPGGAFGAPAPPAPPANDSEEMSGTSMASPMVAGAAMLVAEVLTDYAADDSDADGTTDEETRWDGVDEDGDGIIDEDVGPWQYREENALRLKSLLLMPTYELEDGERVPDDFSIYDRSGNGELRSGPPDELFYDQNGNRQFDPPADINYAPQPAAGGIQRPPLAAATGYPADIVGPLFENGLAWNNPRRDDAGAMRSPFGNGDGYDRGGKDSREGYGHLQIDAAIDAVEKEFCGEEEGTFGGGVADSKVWVRHVQLYSGRQYKVILDGPDMGADFDLYVYRGTLPRGTAGEPELLKDASGKEQRAITKDKADEELSFEVPADGRYFIVARRVSGAGAFTVRLVSPTQWTTLVYMAAESDGKGGDLDTRAFEALNDMEATGSGLEATKDVQVLAQIDYQTRSYDGDAMNNGRAVRYCVRKDHKKMESQYSVRAGNKDLGEVNMGSQQALEDFVKWGVDHFPAEHYALIFWGAGHGWKIAIDAPPIGPGADRTAAGGAANDALEWSEVTPAIVSFGKKIEAGSQYKMGTGKAPFVDLVGWDMDMMQMAEVGEQIRESGGVSVGVMVGSEAREHAEGWPYEEILSGLATNAKMWNGEDLGKHIVAAYDTYFSTKTMFDGRTISAVRLSPRPGATGASPWVEMRTDLSALATELRTGCEDVQKLDDPSDNVEILLKHQGLELALKFQDRGFIDLRDFAYKVYKSGVPEPYRAHAPGLVDKLAKGGAVVLDEKHGPGFKDARGLSIYFPHEELLPERLADLNDYEPSFDNPFPSPKIYAEDAALLLARLRGTNHPRPAVAQFLFPASTTWDELLHRYYKPTADACVRVAGGGCVKVIAGFVGQLFTLSAMGSSDTDGTPQNDVPDTGAAVYIWDHDNANDIPAPLPAYPAPPGGALFDMPCTEDCDRDEVDDADDDPDAFGSTVMWTCPAAGIFYHSVVVWDQTNTIAAQHMEKPYWLNWKLSQSPLIIACLDTWIPHKTPDKYNVIPGDTVTYTLAVESKVATPHIETLVDVVPNALWSLAAPVVPICQVPDECFFNNGTIVWNAAIPGAAPATTVVRTLTYSVTVNPPMTMARPPRQDPPEDPTVYVGREDLWNTLQTMVPTVRAESRVTLTR